MSSLPPAREEGLLTTWNATPDQLKCPWICPQLMVSDHNGRTFSITTQLSKPSLPAHLCSKTKIRVKLLPKKHKQVSSYFWCWERLRDANVKTGPFSFSWGRNNNRRSSRWASASRGPPEFMCYGLCNLNHVQLHKHEVIISILKDK